MTCTNVWIANPTTSPVRVADSVRSNRRSEFEGRAELLRNYIALRESKAGK